MVWSLALRSDDAKQDPVVYGTKFGVVIGAITRTTGIFPHKKLYQRNKNHAQQMEKE